MQKFSGKCYSQQYINNFLICNEIFSSFNILTGLLRYLEDLYVKLHPLYPIKTESLRQIGMYSTSTSILCFSMEISLRL